MKPHRYALLTPRNFPAAAIDFILKNERPAPISRTCHYLCLYFLLYFCFASMLDFRLIIPACSLPLGIEPSLQEIAQGFPQPPASLIFIYFSPRRQNAGIHEAAHHGVQYAGRRRDLRQPPNARVIGVWH